MNSVWTLTQEPCQSRYPAVEQSALCVDYSDNYGSLRGLVSDNFLHAGVVGDTIVGINALSSVLCVEPQIPISLHGRTSTSTAGVYCTSGFSLNSDDFGAFLPVDHHELVAGCMARQTPR